MTDDYLAPFDEIRAVISRILTSEYDVSCRAELSVIGDDDYRVDGKRLVDCKPDDIRPVLEAAARLTALEREEAARRYTDPKQNPFIKTTDDE